MASFRGDPAAGGGVQRECSGQTHLRCTAAPDLDYSAAQIICYVRASNIFMKDRVHVDGAASLVFRPESCIPECVEGDARHESILV